jgi:2-isopropylmalate synthase
VCGLARANNNDIDSAGKALKQAKKRRIHTFISTSNLHMKYKLKMDRKEVIDSIKKSIKRAAKYTSDIEWSPEDASRTELDFLYKSIEVAISTGATTINIPDTVGYAIPNEFGELIKNIKNSVVNIDKAIISVHCHNDLGLAVSNSLSAIISGARQVECTINGIGERAGNAALEEIIMCLKTRKDSLPYYSDVDTKKITNISHLVSTITGFSVQPNKAIVGKNAFAHESGIHQDGMLKHTNTYEIMTPESVGLSSSELVLGKHSGRHAFKVKLNELGYEFSDSKINLLFKKFKELADKKKQVFEEDLLALADEEQSLSKVKYIDLLDISIKCGSNQKSLAFVKLKYLNKTLTRESEGAGPIDAVFKSIKSLITTKAHLVVYQVNAITKGTDAQAEVSVRLEESGVSVLGVGNDIDTIVASGKAYIDGLNKLINKKSKAKDSKKILNSSNRTIDKHVI